MENTININLTKEEIILIESGLRLLKRETRKSFPKENKKVRALSAKISWIEHENKNN